MRPPLWIEGQGALHRLFGPLQLPHHAFNSPLIDWGFKPTEPQITKGWERFLSPARVSGRVSRQRCEDLYHALCVASGASPAALDIAPGSLKVEAEVIVARAQERRFIDLLVSWRNSTGRQQAFAIEFKLGHHITRTQLPSYKAHVRKLNGGDLPNRLFVVAPRLRQHDRSMLNRNRDWRFADWPALLRVLERKMAESGVSADTAYGHFRRMVWHRTTGEQ
jgi:hypothetical protein